MSRPEEESSIIAGHREFLYRVFFNLGLNAVEACGDGDEICFTLDRGKHGWNVVVSDNGPGMSPEVKSRIFNPFFTTKDTGTGLGLAIVHRVLESHGGSVGVSHPTAGGARFTVHLPSTTGQAAPDDFEGDR